MCPTEQPENVEPTIDDAPDAEPLDGRDSQPVTEGSSDDPRTLDAEDPLRDPGVLADETGFPGGGSGLHGDEGGLPLDDASTTPPRGDELADTVGNGVVGSEDTGVEGEAGGDEQSVSPDLGAEPGEEAGPAYSEEDLPDGSGDDNPAHRRRAGDDGERYDAG